MSFEIIGSVIIAIVAIMGILYLWSELHLQSIEGRVIGTSSLKIVVYNSPEVATQLLASRINHTHAIFYMLTGCVCSTLNNPIVLDALRTAWRKRKVSIRILSLRPEVFFQNGETLLNLAKDGILQLAIAPIGYEKVQHLQISDTLLYLENPHPHFDEEGYSDKRTGKLTPKASAEVLNPQIEAFLDLWNKSPKFGESDARNIIMRPRPQVLDAKEGG